MVLAGWEEQAVIYVYIAGPLSGSGLESENVRNAVLAAHRVERMAFGEVAVFLPHITALEHMIDPLPYEDYLRRALAWVEKCDAVLRLPGVSPGADRETGHAGARRIPVFTAEHALNQWIRGLLP